MPIGPRIRANNVLGTIDDNPLATGAVIMNSALLANLPTVSSAHAVVTLDPLRQSGNPEIVIVTAHTASATTATITRGAYGTTARTHPQGTVWIHSPMNEDVVPILTSGTRPVDPYRGETIFETDTNRYVGRSTADVWQQSGLFFDPPHCRVYNNAAQSIANATDTTLAFNSESLDNDTMHDNVTLNSRVTIRTAGLYIINANIEWPTNGTGERTLYLFLNGTTVLPGYTAVPSTNIVDAVGQSTSCFYKFIAGDFIEVRVKQTSTAPLNINSVGIYTPSFSALWVGRGN